VSGLPSLASLSCGPFRFPYIKDQNTNWMSGYTGLLGVPPSLSPTREMHFPRCRLSHVSVWRVRPRVHPLLPLLVRSHASPREAIKLIESEGPFELTKLSAQISVLMADTKDSDHKNDAIRKSYQNLGTLRTARKLVENRGYMGLYSGFHLHLRELNCLHSMVISNI
jgi:hypothetical protein